MRPIEAASWRKSFRWRALEHVGLEQLTIAGFPDRIEARGVLIGENEAPFAVFYDVVLEVDWSFRSAAIRRDDGIEYELRQTAAGWEDSTGPRPDLADCVDIDLSGSAFTNTLPIRRLGLPPGASRQLSMAWVPLDTLETFRDGQVYTCMDVTHYHYRAVEGGFEADITVDADGFILEYPPLFSRV